RPCADQASEETRRPGLGPAQPAGRPGLLDGPARGDPGRRRSPRQAGEPGPGSCAHPGAPALQRHGHEGDRGGPRGLLAHLRTPVGVGAGLGAQGARRLPRRRRLPLLLKGRLPGVRMDSSRKSRFEVPYSPDRYRRLSEHFHACADLGQKERESYLRGPRVADTGLREELRTLLRYHAPAEAGSEDSALRPRRKNRHRAPLLISAIGAATTLFILLLRTSTLDRVESALRDDAVRSLRDVVESRSALVRAWAQRQKERARAALEDPDFAAHVAVLSGTAESS